MTQYTGTDGNLYNVDFVLTPAVVTPASLVISADGSTATVKQGIFTTASIGSVTVSPVTNPPPVNDPSVGIVTNFTPAAMNRFNVDGLSYGVHNANKSWSLTNPDPQTLRFEIRQGEHSWEDGASVDRSEITGVTMYPANKKLTIDYQFKLEPNGTTFTNNAWFFLLGQMHNDDNAAGTGTSPPFAFQLAGDKLQVVKRTCPTGKSPANGSSSLVTTLPWTDTKPLALNVWHTVHVEVLFMNDSTGYLRVTVDGVKVVNYSGPIGYGYATNWEYGLYRNACAETQAISYRAVRVTAA